jgi:enoyl-CoA hydratase
MRPQPPGGEVTDSAINCARVGAGGGVLVIRLDRPRYRNAQSRALLRDLDAAFAEGSADPEVRVIVLASTSEDFSSGHDLRTADELADTSSPVMPGELGAREDWSWSHWTAPLQRWRRIPKPTIAAISGNCLWGGWSLASAMDIRVCTSNAAILPHLSEYFALPWIVSVPIAKDILFRNRVITATEALAYGMVTTVCGEGDDLDETVLAIAEEIADVPSEFLRAIKTSLNGIEDMRGFDASLALSNSQHLMSEWAHTDPSAQGVAGTADSTSLVASAIAKHRAAQV